MALWLVRAGKYGQHEEKFFGQERIYLTWTELADVGLGEAKDFEGVKVLVRRGYPDASERVLGGRSGQAWAFVVGMKPGDWVVLPRKHKPAIAFGEVTGPYDHMLTSEPLYRHSRKVKWLNTEVPRSAFDQDLLYSFGACMTVCEIRRNNAEKRVRAMAATGWEEGENGGEGTDLERLGRDQIAKLIARAFKGHAMAALVEAILKGQGYTTYRSPEGPDKGVDILAAPGPLGFGRPRICVQVKSSDMAVDRPTLDQLVGTMQNVQAEQGLLVSWGGFRSSIDKETAHHFFRVRLWDQDDLIDQLLEQYDGLAEDLRTQLPLKHIWTVASQEEQE